MGKIASVQLQKLVDSMPGRIFEVIKGNGGYTKYLIKIYLYIHKHLSKDENLFYAHVTSGAVWHLTLRKISPSQDSYFEHMVTGK